VYPRFFGEAHERECVSALDLGLRSLRVSELCFLRETCAVGMLDFSGELFRCTHVCAA
jgi:hypothetical protein